MGMSEKFDDIIAGLVSKIAGLVSKAERASASLREYSDHALALRFDREVAIVEFGDWYYFRLMGGDWERGLRTSMVAADSEIDWVEIVRKFCRRVVDEVELDARLTDDQRKSLVRQLARLRGSVR